MGCQSSTEEALDLLDASTVLPGGSYASAKAVPIGDLQKVVPPAEPSKTGTRPSPYKSMDKQAAPMAKPAATEGMDRELNNLANQPFPLPEGWRVVCRLSPNDARSRWGTRPRPPSANNTSSLASSGTNFEADLIAPELNQPLKLPVLLLPQWIEPKVGANFVGRYEVRRELPIKPTPQPGMKKGRRFEGFDKQDNVEVAVQVCELASEVDVKSFTERLQMEALDRDNVLFLRLRNVALALPGRLALVEDLPQRSLWQEFGSGVTMPGFGAKLANVANSVLSGLCRLHAHGWAHCGISPETVCLASDGHWKLTSLELACKVKSLTPDIFLEIGTIVEAPEVLLGIPLTEKVDVWQLAATICEAIMQRRIIDGGGASGGRQRGIASKLCALVDFLGPMPSDLVARHPLREAFFTPEGQVLRPATPDAHGAVLEAIEPSVAQAPSVGSDHIQRPRLIAEALAGIEGGNDILEFLGHLLNPDPEQRPSAQEATAHHFLRFAHTKTKTTGVRLDMSHEHHAQIEDSGGDKEGKIVRKGTGFVHTTDLPETDDEDEDENPTAAGGAHHVQISDSHGDHENKICRKGTGFVHMGELPVSSDEEEDDDERGGQKQAPTDHHAQIQDAHGDNENKIVRKGTGFVHASELPASDDEDEEEDNHHVQITDSHGDNENKICRKGTGFVHMGELPVSSDEEEEDEEPARDGKHASITDSHGDNENKICRKGTGFVNVGELPPSDDEEEKEIAHVHIEDSHGDNENKICRKGTGFVHMGELPVSSDEEDEEENAVAIGNRASTGHAQIQDEHGDNENKICRKGTGFVHVGELPPSDDEDEDDDENHHHVQITDSHGDNENKICRKGTGFVHMGELPVSSDEEDDEEEGVPCEHRASTGHAQIQDTHGDNENKLVRKGTGFVHVGELPPSDDEDEEEDTHHVQITDSHGDNENKICRKGTGFVHMGELPVSSDEEEEDEEQGRVGKHASITDSHGDNENKICRKGTGFVHVGELPPSDDEEEEENVHVHIEDSHGDNENKICRKGTGFVHMGELPVSSDEEDEEENAVAIGNRASTSHAQIQDDHGDNENKLVRKGTGFVHVGELPPSDDEDEEDSHHVQITDSHGDNENKICRKGTGFVHMGELPVSSDEEDEEEEVSKPVSSNKVHIEDTQGDTENKICRKGTGFVHMGELPLSSDEEDEDEEVSKPVSSNKARIEDTHGDNESKICRKGTGFVHTSELPPSDDEDEEDVEGARVGFTEAEKPKGNVCRAGTGFVRAEDLDELEDEDDEDRRVMFQADDSDVAKPTKNLHNPAKPMRKGTGFVSASELPDSDDEQEED